MRNTCATVALILLLSACTSPQTAVTAVDAAYVTRLNARMAQYNQTADALEASLQSAGSAARPGSSLQNASVAGAPRTTAELMQSVREAAEARARVAILKRFMDEAAASGGLGFMYSWLQNQFSELKRFSDQTDTKVAAVQKDAAANPNNPQLAQRIVSLVRERGAEQGGAEELQTIFNDVRGYDLDYTDAAASDRRRQTEPRSAVGKAIEAYIAVRRSLNDVEAPAVQFPRTIFTTCMPGVMGGTDCAPK
jgi:hypothetical protein